MISKMGNVATILVLAVFLVAPSAQAGTTYNGSFTVQGESLSIFSDFSFDGSTTSSAVLNTGWRSDSLGDSGPSQGVSEVAVDTTGSCSFKSLYGITESGNPFTLVSSASAGHNISGPLHGDFAFIGQTETGCINEVDGNFAGTGTNLISGLTGANKGATGTSTFKFVGVTLASPATGLKSGYGFFQWFKSTGTFVEHVP